MKKILVAMILISFGSTASSHISPKEMEAFTKMLCDSHSDQKLCVKSYYRLMSYVQANDDYFMKCKEFEKSGMTFSKEGCKQSEELREYILRENEK